jgi:hypothetical protein
MSAQILLHAAELALYASPFLLLAGLLLTGRFVGEQTILRRRVAAVVPRPRHERARWPRVTFRVPLAALVHDPRVERGPPAPAPAAA